MTERKKLEAIGDGLLLAVARLYLKERHPHVSYSLYTRLTISMVNNDRLTELAALEGIRGHDGEKLASAFEVSIAERLYRDGFAAMRAWLWSLFDKHIDIEGEVRRMTGPQPVEKLERQVRGALKQALKNQGGKITDIQKTAKMIVSTITNQ